MTRVLRWRRTRVFSVGRRLGWLRRLVGWLPAAGGRRRCRLRAIAADGKAPGSHLGCDRLATWLDRARWLRRDNCDRRRIGRRRSRLRATLMAREEEEQDPQHCAGDGQAPPAMARVLEVEATALLDRGLAPPVCCSGSHPPLAADALLGQLTGQREVAFHISSLLASQRPQFEVRELAVPDVVLHMSGVRRAKQYRRVPCQEDPHRSAGLVGMQQQAHHSPLG